MTLVAQLFGVIVESQEVHTIISVFIEQKVIGSIRADWHFTLGSWMR